MSLENLRVIGRLQAHAPDQMLIRAKGLAASQPVAQPDGRMGLQNLRVIWRLQAHAPDQVLIRANGAALSQPGAQPQEIG
jgi:hypothetical protein